MIIIETTADLDQPMDQEVKRLLALRIAQLMTDAGGVDLGDLALFVVVEPGDAIDAIEAAAGYPVVTEQAFEWAQRHGRLFEAVTVLTDDGYAVVLVVPDDEAIDPLLLVVLREEVDGGAIDPAPPDRGHIRAT